MVNVFQKKFDATMYFILICITIYVWWTEHIDIHCPSFTSTKEGCQKRRNGIQWYKARDGDSCEVLIDKIYKAAGAEQASIKWRRAFAFSVAIMGCMWLLVGSFDGSGGSPNSNSSCMADVLP